MRTLVFDELTFSAAHYIPGHPKCGAIHGHTYFIRNLEVSCSKFVDLGTIKELIGSFDHVMIIPYIDLPIWNEIIREKDWNEPRFDIITTNGDPTVENISQQLAEMLKKLDGVENVSFELYEGPNQGVEYP